MSNPIEYYFDFTSPFGYLGSRQIEAIAAKHGRVVSWKPIVLGFIFRLTESKPIIEVPLKGEYTKHDLKRCARELGIEYSLPTPFPINTVTAARAVLWAQSLETETNSQQSTDFIHALYSAYFVAGRDISTPEEVTAAAESVGISASMLSAALQEPDVKSLLKQAVDTAVEKNVFGSPYILADSEPFWGSDRLPQLDRWLASGGW